MKGRGIIKFAASACPLLLALRPLMAQVAPEELPPRLNIEQVLPSDYSVVGDDIRMALAPGPRPGDQVNSVLISRGDAGLLVWQDNAIDGQGAGIGLQRVSLSTGAGSPRVSKVNEAVVGDQALPAAVFLADGRAVVVWQSSVSGTSSIRGRLVAADGTPSGREFPVSQEAAGDIQTRPSIVALSGGFAVAWETQLNTDARRVLVARFDASANPLGSALTLHSSGYSDRAPSIAARADGSLLVSWIGELCTAEMSDGYASRREANADVLLTLIDPSGMPGVTQWVNRTGNPCDSPVVCALPAGGATVVWSEYDTEVDESWNIRQSTFDFSLARMGTPATLNTYRPFEQYSPRIAASAEGCLVTWTSRGADGSGLGISGRLISNRGLPVGDEVVFNSSKANDQSHAAVAKTPAGYRVVWSALTGIDSGVDIYGRMFNKVSTVTAGRLKISWQSYPGVRYRLESSPDLALWSQEAGVVTAVANQSSVALDPAATSAKFFRISIVR